MAIQIKSDRRETENKTVRFPVDLISRIEQVMKEKDVSFSGFVIQACEYVVDELENEKAEKWLFCINFTKRKGIKSRLVPFCN